MPFKNLEFIRIIYEKLKASTFACHLLCVSGKSSILIYEHWTEVIVKETLSYVHPLIQFMLELFQAIECSFTSSWSSAWHSVLLAGQVGQGMFSHPAAKSMHPRYTALLPNSWPVTGQTHCFFSSSWKNNSLRPNIRRGKMIMELAGLGAWSCLLSVSTNDPWQVHLKLKLITSLKCHRNRSGKAKPKADEFHENKAISFSSSAYRKISESTLSFPKRHLCC